MTEAFALAWIDPATRKGFNKGGRRLPDYGIVFALRLGVSTHPVSEYLTQAAREKEKSV